MSDFEVWIGDCHLRSADGDGDGDGGGEYRCQAAVWARDFESFRRVLSAHVEGLGYGILWLEEVLPAPQYLGRHGAQLRQVGALAQAVHPGHPAELGPMESMGGDGIVAPESYLTIEDHVLAPLADQSGLPFWEREWIIPELKELLFGQPEEGPRMRTYLIVDATLRKNITGVFDLDSIDVPVQCLFQGASAEELRETAPYLIDMTLPDGAWESRDLVPSFHRDFFRTHWGRNTGIFIRSTGPMAEVRGHFRKFTLVPREGHDARVFVRFWDEQYARLYFPHIAGNKDRVAMWFLRNGFCVGSILADQQGGTQVRAVMLRREQFVQHNASPVPFVVTAYDLEPFHLDRDRKDIRTLAEALKQGFSERLKHYSPETIEALISDPVSRMRGYGFSKKSSLYLLAAWSIFFGGNFERKDPDGMMLDICESDLGEVDKMNAMKRRMGHLSVPKEAAS